MNCSDELAVFNDARHPKIRRTLRIIFLIMLLVWFVLKQNSKTLTIVPTKMEKLCEQSLVSYDNETRRRVQGGITLPTDSGRPKVFLSSGSALGGAAF